MRKFGYLMIGSIVALGLAAPVAAHDTSRNNRHDRQHERLERSHDRSHDRLEDAHDRAHWWGIGRREHRRLHRWLGRQHDRTHDRLEHRHDRQHYRDHWDDDYYRAPHDDHDD